MTVAFLLPYFVTWHFLDYFWISSLLIIPSYIESILSSCTELHRPLEKEQVGRVK